MNQNAIYEQVAIIFKDILEDDTLQLSLSTTPETVEDWNSLAHIQLIVAIEKSFGIKFTAMEAEDLNSIGDIVDTIGKKDYKV